MINRAIYLLTAADDFGLEQRDALVQFLDGKWIEVLARQLRGGIVVASGKIVRFHCGAASDAVRAKSSSPAG